MTDRTAPRVAVVDFGLGNLFSVTQACRHAGMAATVTGEAASFDGADALLLPGVGAFGDAMAALTAQGLVESIRAWAEEDRPLIGICLGMQLLMSESREFGVHAGLGLIAGTVERLNANPPRLKVPNVGWARIDPATPGAWAGSALDGLAAGSYMYFVHSFVARPTDPGVVLSLSRHGDENFCSSLRSGNIFACQFHPERSGSDGLAVYRNLGRMLSERKKTSP